MLPVGQISANFFPPSSNFSTGTSYPSENEKEMWETFEVNEGRFNPLISPVHND